MLGAGIDEAAEAGRVDAHFVQVARQRLRELFDRCAQQRHEAALCCVVCVVDLPEAHAGMALRGGDVERLEVDPVAIGVCGQIGQRVEHTPLA